MLIMICFQLAQETFAVRVSALLFSTSFLTPIAVSSDNRFFQYDRVEGMGSVQQLCFCGAPTCQGFIGWRKTGTEEAEADAAGNRNGNRNGKASSLSSSAAAQKRKRALAAAAERERVFRESECYMCQDDHGDLLICDGSLRAGVPCAKVRRRLAWEKIATKSEFISPR